MRDETFANGDLHTAFLDQFMKRAKPAADGQTALIAGILAAAHPQFKRPQPPPETGTASLWQAEGRRRMLR
jgi:hypothetical protein